MKIISKCVPNLLFRFKISWSVGIQGGDKFSSRLNVVCFSPVVALFQAPLPPHNPLCLIALPCLVVAQQSEFYSQPRLILHEKMTEVIVVLIHLFTHPNLAPSSFLFEL